MKNLQRMNQHSLDEEGREEDKEKEEPIAAGMDEGGGEGKLVKSEEPYERLHCKKCNFVTSAKSKKVRIDRLRRHVKSHHAGKSIIIAAYMKKGLLWRRRLSGQKKIGGKFGLKSPKMA